MGWFFNRCFACVVSMQIIQRFLLLLVFCIPAFLPNTSFATSTYDAQITSWGGQPTPEAACAGYYPAGATTVIVSTYQAKCTQTAWPNGIQYVNARTTCQAGDTISGPNVITGTNYANGPATCTTTRTCTAPQVMGTDGNCTAPPCVAGCTGACGSPYKIFTGEYPSSGCVGGCNYKFGDGIQSSGDNNWIVMVGSNLGTTCTNPTTPATTGNSPEYDCVKQGKSYGTVNGVVVCTTMGTTGSQPAVKLNTSTGTSSKTTTDANGTPTTTSQDTTKDSVTKYNTDGSVQTTTTQTTVNGDGTSEQSTTDKTETKDDFCASNPTSKACSAQTQCQENPEGPTCKHFCDKFPNSVACTDADTYIGKASDIPSIGNLTTTNIDFPSALPSIAINANASCPSPVTFTKYGASATVSFDWLCSYASYFKPLLIAFSLLAAAYIVNGSRRDD